MRALAAVLIGCGAAVGNDRGRAGRDRPARRGRRMGDPALHSAASDQPLPAAQSCTTSGFPVCVDRAFSFYLLR